MQALRWDIFCRVVDNHGDIGVCWRLSCDLAARGQAVRLWIDDASALRWMAPDGHDGVETIAWNDASAVPAHGDGETGDVVIEAFGCDLPEEHLRRMASRVKTPVWLNLEYLSAESYVERSHGLLSPQSSGPGAGLRKWFFYPGFTRATGGLLREAGLLERCAAFDRIAWLGGLGIERRQEERVVSVFCYEQPALDTWITQWSQEPTLLLATSGHAARQVASVLGPSMKRGALRASIVPALPQTEYDHLLWASDLNVVRGEDSFVRAQWAGVPFLWHIYRQDDDAHVAKLDAFLDHFLAASPPDLRETVTAQMHAWNTGTAAPALASSGLDAAWREHCVTWRGGLAQQDDLTTQLMGFVGRIVAERG